jgi:hypothetical protein
VIQTDGLDATTSEQKPKEIGVSNIKSSFALGLEFEKTQAVALSAARPMPGKLPPCPHPTWQTLSRLVPPVWPMGSPQVLSGCSQMAIRPGRLLRLLIRTAH